LFSSAKIQLVAYKEKKETGKLFTQIQLLYRNYLWYGKFKERDIKSSEKTLENNEGRCGIGIPDLYFLI